jgi:FlaA1/EpsC-like NDP-sugar epimerase
LIDIAVRNEGARSEGEDGAIVGSGARRHAHYRALEAGYDAIAWYSGLMVAGWVTRDLGRPYPVPLYLARAAVAVGVVAVVVGLLSGLYRGRYQRGSLDEVIAVVRAGCGTSLVLAVLGGPILPGQRAPLHAVVGGALFALLAMIGARYMVVAVRQSSRPQGAPGVKVIVFGAGSAGAALVHSLARQKGAQYRPVAFLDDDPAKRRLRIGGVPVLGDRTQMAQVAAQTGATVLVIAIARASGSAIRDLASEADRCGLIPKVIPSITELLAGGVRIEGVRDPRITDLLGRMPVTTNIAQVAGFFAGKRILVTGAGGSVGSELCRQLHRLGSTELIMLDRDESALHAIQLELYGRALLDSDQVVLADIRDAARMREVLEHFGPQIVFHAAALKHLPLLERAPAEALKSNVWGTLNVLEAAASCGVESFVNISTDKAADPVSVLGYSKRIAERLTADMASRARARYVSVRFGNVLGSRGSVLTALSAQVAAGGPLTVTHPDVTRYLMTAGEAVQLVLQAAVIGRAGEVLVLDMGQPVRILDLARRLAAQAPEPVEIVFTGLRPGEKLSETLLGAGELDDRPYHPLISHVPAPPVTGDQVRGLDVGRAERDVRADLARCAAVACEGMPTAPIGGSLTGKIRGPRQDLRVVPAKRQAAQP